MINEKNIFEKGMLVSLKIGGYLGRKKLSEEQMGALPKEIVRAVHDLFEGDFKKKLQEVASFDMQTRHMLNDMSVPFPIEGIHFVLSEQIEPLITALDGRKSQRDEMIAELAQNYEGAKQKFAEKYPDYYRKAQKAYPSKERFVARFYSEYQFLKISPPGKNDNLISPELYKQEMTKFKDAVTEMKQEVVSTIHGELIEMVARLKRQCTDGKPNQRTLNNLNKYLVKIDEVFGEFVDRKDLKEIAQKIKAEILGVTAEGLRDSDADREKFRQGMGDILSSIEALPDIPLKRALEF